MAAFYLIARLWRLDDSCLVFDEIFSVHAATHSWASLLPFAAEDLIHPPLFYLLLKIWILAGGESLYWLRLFPVFWSVLAIIPFLFLCLELKLKAGETLTAFVLLATNGALIRYSQEVRMYSLLFCVALVSAWLFVKLINYLPGQESDFARLTRFPTKIFGALFLVNLLLIYTHYFGWLVILSELTVFLILCRSNSTALIQIQRGKRGIAFFYSVGLLALCFAPWAIWVLRQASQINDGLGQNLGWAAKPGFVKIRQFVLTLGEPFYYQLSSIDAPNTLIIAVPLALIIISAFLILILSKEKDESLLVICVFAFIPLVAAFLASWTLPYSIWGVRHLIIIFAPISILAAIAVWRLPLRELRYAALSLLGALILIAGFLHFVRSPQTFIWCGWRELASQLNTQTPTTIYVFEDDGVYQLWYALKDNSKFKIVSIDGYGDMPEDKAYFLPRGFDDVKVADKNAIQGDNFYLAFRETSWKPDKQVLRELSERGYKIETPFEFRAQGGSAFLVPIQKVPK